ncbi:MAG: peptidoglycan-binding protein [Lachnospiraceae bacterium]|jgi:peptidoglycan hydrolase-like protein with peptidoglycan-binding domain|nr:peptidoglycan-binding protein [Lachnospiraceae bacterium]
MRNANRRNIRVHIQAFNLRRPLARTALPAFLALALLTSCAGGGKAATEPQTPPQTQPVYTIEDAIAPAEIPVLTPQGPVYRLIKDIPVPPPEIYYLGISHPNVAKLQERLMDLGFMDYDEPTYHYGNMTVAAVKLFQRQNDLNQDGRVGPLTWEAIMDPAAGYYTVTNGDSGEDVQLIQYRLYELGYLPSADMVTGNFGDVTENSVKKLQELNGLEIDGKVGRQTTNLLYSGDVKPNLLAYGEHSEVVLACQVRLKDLGYLTTEPDGAYGNDTILAVKQFQSRNDLVVDGYLGPSTRMALDSSAAKPNGLRLGDEGDAISRVQELLAKLGYLYDANVTGYFGDITQRAVKAFQTRNGLSADGSVGRQTMARLTSQDAKKAASGAAALANSGGSTSTSSGAGSSGSGASGSGSGASASAGSSGATSPTQAADAGSGGATAVGSVLPSGNASVDALLAVASSKLGAPYSWGGKGPNSFDCSGFVYWCLNQVGVQQSYITSYGWQNVGRYERVSSYYDLRAGDIIVVRGHVGIIAGGGTIIDASSGNGRVIHRSLGQWWADHFIVGWRIFG